MWVACKWVAKTQSRTEQKREEEKEEGAHRYEVQPASGRDQDKRALSRVRRGGGGEEEAVKAEINLRDFASDCQGHFGEGTILFEQ